MAKNEEDGGDGVSPQHGDEDINNDCIGHGGGDDQEDQEYMDDEYSTSHHPQQEQQPQHVPTHANLKENRIPSLASMCLKVVSSKIERYPPNALGSISELEWEDIVRQRHEATAPKFQSKKSSPSPSKATSSLQKCGLSGTGRALPAISDKHLLAIEKCNVHLSHSKVVDELVWKDCVEYKFKTGGPTRPKVLSEPWPYVVERLKKCGEVLLSLLKRPEGWVDEGDDAEDVGAAIERSKAIRAERSSKMKEVLDVLTESPMSVPLLTDSGVGKAVNKFVKNCTRIRHKNGYYDDDDVIHDDDLPPYVVNVWKPLLPSPSSKQQQRSHHIVASSSSTSDDSSCTINLFQKLLLSWKNVASASGVVVSGAAAGGNKPTIDNAQQHRDLITLRTCKSWRELFVALQGNEKKMVADHGKRMRRIRENLDAGRKTVKKCTTRAMEGSTRVRRREAMLDKALGGRRVRSVASTATALYGASGNEKMRALKQESARASSLRKAAAVGGGAGAGAGVGGAGRASMSGLKRKLSPQAQAPTSSFGDAIASASGNKRKVVELGGGKRMRMPKTYNPSPHAKANAETSWDRRKNQAEARKNSSKTSLFNRNRRLR